MIEQRAANNDDLEIRDSKDQVPLSKSDDIVKELSLLNIENAAKLAIKHFNNCMTVHNNSVTVVNEKVYESFYYLSFFDLSQLSEE